MSAYGLALRRFWWVVVIGVVVATAAAYKVVKNDEVAYRAQARLLVTSSENPYIRTAFRLTGQAPSPEDPSRDVTFTYVVAPDVRTLVQAANLYPIFIESDDVSRVRQEMFGDLPGRVTAQGYGATVTQTRLELGEIPVIEIVGIASGPKQAVDVTRSTTEAFVSWMTQTQERSGVAESDRILIQDIQVPTSATPIGEGSAAIPIGVGAAIALGFALVAILLDRLVPARRARPDDRPAEGLTASS